jgi:hypothetical protein
MRSQQNNHTTGATVMAYYFPEHEWAAVLHPVVPTKGLRRMGGVPFVVYTYVLGAASTWLVSMAALLSAHRPRLRSPTLFAQAVDP